jgi:hypothetical protein
MSEEFIQYRFPCSECLVQAACKDYDGNRKQLKDIREERPSLAVPIFDQTKKSYHKGLMECWANMGASLMGKVSKTEDPLKHQKVDNLPMSYVHVLWAMAQIMCHIVNTTSWRKGELYEFDRIEIKSRLSKLKGWL